jgi:hypothetical protein
MSNLLNKIWNPLIQDFELLSEDILKKYIKAYVNGLNIQDGGSEKPKKKRNKKSIIQADFIQEICSPAEKRITCFLLKNIYPDELIGSRYQTCDTIHNNIMALNLSDADANGAYNDIRKTIIEEDVFKDENRDFQNNIRRNFSTKKYLNKSRLSIPIISRRKVKAFPVLRSLREFPLDFYLFFLVMEELHLIATQSVPDFLKGLIVSEGMARKIREGKIQKKLKLHDNKMGDFHKTYETQTWDDVRLETDAFVFYFDLYMIKKKDLSTTNTLYTSNNPTKILGTSSNLQIEHALVSNAANLASKYSGSESFETLQRNVLFPEEGTANSERGSNWLDFGLIMLIFMFPDRDFTDFLYTKYTYKPSGKPNQRFYHFRFRPRQAVNDNATKILRTQSPIMVLPKWLFTDVSAGGASAAARKSNSGPSLNTFNGLSDINKQKCCILTIRFYKFYSNIIAYKGRLNNGPNIPIYQNIYNSIGTLTFNEARLDYMAETGAYYSILKEFILDGMISYPGPEKISYLQRVLTNFNYTEPVTSPNSRRPNKGHFLVNPISIAHYILTPILLRARPIGARNDFNTIIESLREILLQKWKDITKMQTPKMQTPKKPSFLDYLISDSSNKKTEINLYRINLDQSSPRGLSAVGLPPISAAPAGARNPYGGPDDSKIMVTLLTFIKQYTYFLSNKPNKNNRKPTDDEIKTKITNYFENNLGWIFKGLCGYLLTQQPRSRAATLTQQPGLDSAGGAPRVPTDLTEPTLTQQLDDFENRIIQRMDEDTREQVQKLNYEIEQTKNERDAVIKKNEYLGRLAGGIATVAEFNDRCNVKIYQPGMDISFIEDEVRIVTGARVLRNKNRKVYFKDLFPELNAGILFFQKGGSAEGNSSQNSSEEEEEWLPGEEEEEEEEVNSLHNSLDNARPGSFDQGVSLPGAEMKARSKRKASQIAADTAAEEWCKFARGFKNIALYLHYNPDVIKIIQDHIYNVIVSENKDETIIISALKKNNIWYGMYNYDKNIIKTAIKRSKGSAHTHPSASQMASFF